MKLFTEHPKSIGESYIEHMCVALTFGFKMIIGGLACIMHGFFPFLFQTTGSRTIFKLSEKFSNRSTEKQESSLPFKQP